MRICTLHTQHPRIADENECLHVAAAADQNTVKNIRVVDIDIGVYLGPEVNGNQVSGVMMGGIGEAAYFIDGPNSENTITGGFVAGCVYNGHLFHTRWCKLPPSSMVMLKGQPL